MSTEVNKMFGRFFKTGESVVSQTLKSLKNPTIQMVIGGILILYISFLESETDSVLSLFMMNPLGRLLVLLLLVFIAYVNVPLGLLFAILIVMSCANKSGFMTMTVPEGFQTETSPESVMGNLQSTVQQLMSGQEMKEETEKEKEKTEGFAEHDAPEKEPADGKKEDAPKEGAGVEGFTSRSFSLYQ
jgi:hypothetical protein